MTTESNYLEMPRDFATAERKRYVRNVSPFHRHESMAPYIIAWMLSLICGRPMPHERGSK